MRVVPVPRGVAVRSVRLLARHRAINLAFHGVAPHATHDPDFLLREPGRFREDLVILLEAGMTFVTVAELVRRRNAGEPLAGLATISFDDGLQDNHAIALPLLDELGIPATVYVITGLIGKPNPWLGEGEGRMMTEAELLELHAAGIELGAHTVTHPDLSTLDYGACLEEMRASRDHLEQLTGAPVTTFAYPYCRFGPEAVRAAEDAGFAGAVTCIGNGTDDRFAIERAMITGKDGTAGLLVKASGAYHPLFDSLPGRVVRRTTRGLRARVRGAAPD